VTILAGSPYIVKTADRGLCVALLDKHEGGSVLVRLRLSPGKVVWSGRGRWINASDVRREATRREVVTATVIEAA